MSHLVLASLILATFGCSLLGDKQSARKKSDKFHSADADEEVLPADIAHDISILKTGGSLEPSKAWKKVPDQEPQRTVASDGIHLPNPSESQGAAPNEAVSAEESAPASGPIVNDGSQAQSTSVSTGGGTESYKIEPGDTLMEISFAKYGNVYRWREIYRANLSLIQDFNNLVPGTVITIYGVEYFVLEKNGQPYLIRRGDTLGKISKSLYGSPEHWNVLWKNNPRLIRNPHRIYAGFTLYYPAKEELKEELNKR